MTMMVSPAVQNMKWLQMELTQLNEKEMFNKNTEEIIFRLSDIILQVRDATDRWEKA